MPRNTINLAMDRRLFLGGAGSVLALPARSNAALPAVRAIAFDAFTVFDPGSLTVLAEKLMGNRASALVAQWSARLFSYTWLETAAGQYQGFLAIADDALRLTARTLGIPLDDAERQALVSHYGELDAWPDARPALDRLRQCGVRLVLLSNLGRATLASNLARNGLADWFEPSLSTDAVRQFKPAPAAYAMALKTFNLPKSQIGFAAFGGWDAIGAGWFGYRTAWINRSGTVLDPLGKSPEVTSQKLDGVLTLAGIA